MARKPGKRLRRAIGALQNFRRALYARCLHNYVFLTILLAACVFALGWSALQRGWTVLTWTASVLGLVGFAAYHLTYIWQFVKLGDLPSRDQYHFHLFGLWQIVAFDFIFLWHLALFLLVAARAADTGHRYDLGQFFWFALYNVGNDNLWNIPEALNLKGLLELRGIIPESQNNPFARTTLEAYKSVLQLFVYTALFGLFRDWSEARQELRAIRAGTVVPMPLLRPYKATAFLRALQDPENWNRPDFVRSLIQRLSESESPQVADAFLRVFDKCPNLDVRDSIAQYFKEHPDRRFPRMAKLRGYEPSGVAL